MKTLLALFILSLSAVAEVHDNPTVMRQWPMQGYDWSYFAYKIVYNSSGQIIEQGPVPDLWINMIIIDDESSGGHTHGSDSDARPNQTPMQAVLAPPLQPGETLTRRKTGADGKAHFSWKGDGFAGKVTTLLVPEDITWRIEQFHALLEYFEKIPNGSTWRPRNLKLMQDYGETKSFTRHGDTRHKNTIGQPGNTRSGTEPTLVMADFINKYYKQLSPTGSALDITRISLGSGGCHDGKFQPGSSTAYYYLTWVMKACNAFGVEIDYENPALDSGGIGSATGDAAYGLFIQVMNNGAKCRTSKFKDDGSPIPTDTVQVPGYFPGGPPIIVYKYWRDAPIVSVVCTLDPKVDKAN